MVQIEMDPDGWTGMVGYNVQTAVDTRHHLFVAHDVTNVGHDRTQLFNVERQAKDAIGAEKRDVVTDRGYYKGEETLEGIHALSDENPETRQYRESLHVLAYNLKRVLSILDAKPLSQQA